MPCISPEQSMSALLQLLLGLSLGCTGAGGFVAHVESTCLLDDEGTPQDFTYCISFNKDLLTCWDPQETRMVPCEFGALNALATYFSVYLNQQEKLLQRLSNGLQNCATHTQPFWKSLTHRTRSDVPGVGGAQAQEYLEIWNLLPGDSDAYSSPLVTCIENYLKVIKKKT